MTAVYLDTESVDLVYKYDKQMLTGSSLALSVEVIVNALPTERLSIKQGGDAYQRY